MPDRSKYYSSRGNCQRAAKVVLGETAKSGYEFTLVENPDKKGQWAWKPKGKDSVATVAADAADPAPAAEKTKRRRAKKGEKSNILEQPAMRAAWSLAQRKTGVTVAEGAERTNSNKDTFRGKMSVCRKAKCPITTQRAGRQITYFLAPEWAP